MTRDEHIVARTFCCGAVVGRRACLTLRGGGVSDQFDAYITSCRTLLAYIPPYHHHYHVYGSYNSFLRGPVPLT